MVSPTELSYIRSGLPVAASDGKAKLVSWEQLFGSRDVLALTVSYFAFGYVAWIFLTWFFIYLLDARGVNLKASALYATAPFIAMAIFSPLGGVIGDWVTRKKGSRVGRCGIAVPAMILASAFLVAGSRAQSTRVAVFVLAGGVGALYLSASSFWSVTTEIGGASSGTVSGFMNMGNQFGGILTQLLTPWIAARHGWTAPFIVAAAVCLGGALTWLLVDPERRLETHDA